MPSAHRRRLGASAVDWLREVAVVTAKTRICDDWLIGIRGTGQPMSLFEELKRRNVIRMVGLYVVGAWLITQVAGTVLPMFGAPDWIARSIVALLAIGFVPTMLFSWIYELTPEGLKRESEIDRSASITSLTARRIDRSITVLLVLALGYFAVDKFVLAPGRTDPAFEWLEKANEYKDGGLSEIVYEPLFDKIRNDPRWLPFLRKIGRAPEQLAKIEFEVTLPR